MAKQRSFEWREGWGGARKGAGRKAVGRPGVAHRPRAVCRSYEPQHVTLRLVDGLPSMRRPDLAAAIGQVFRTLAADAKRCENFRVVHFSIQGNHLHLLVEAEDNAFLSNGMRGLSIRLAKAANRVLGRNGRFVADRFHARALTTPTEVRHVLVYIFQNYKHHPDRYVRTYDGVDVASSARWFAHWDRPPVPTGPSPVSPARTWLVYKGWLHLGLLRREEAPAGCPR